VSEQIRRTIRITEDHGHSHGLGDRSIIRSRAGVKAVSVSLAVLVLASLVQLAVFVLSGSVALLADLIHNFSLQRIIRRAAERRSHAYPSMPQARTNAAAVADRQHRLPFVASETE